MKKLLLLLVLVTPCFVFAEEENLEVVARAVKYVKTVTVLNNSEIATMANPEQASFTTEITEEEYNAVEVDDFMAHTNTIIHTTYKKLETTLAKNGQYYRYRVDLTWKNMPATRSYDIIGVGYYASVKPSAFVGFREDYCMSDGNCYKSNGYTEFSGNNGIAALFYLPSGSLTSLSQYFYVDVTKTNSSSTIISQMAVGDYAHATKSVSYNNAKNFIIDVGGITHDSSVRSYFDTMPEATAAWTGTW